MQAINNAGRKRNQGNTVRRGLRVDTKLNEIDQHNFMKYIVEALKVDIGKRDIMLMQVLYKATLFFEFFIKMIKNDKQGELNHRKCCERMSYQENKRGDLIIKHQDLPDKFYIILEGNVSVFIQRFKQGNDEEKALNMLLLYSGQKNLTQEDITDVSTKENFNPQIMTAIQQFDCIQNEQVKYKYSFLKENIKEYGKTEIDPSSGIFKPNGVLNYKQVATMKQGVFIGELAILEGTPRNATIIAESKVVKLAYLTKVDFKKILMDGEMALKREQRKQFFQKKVLNGDPLLARQISTNSQFYLFEEQNLSFGTNIFQEGDLAQYIYVVKSGQVALIKKVPVDEHDRMLPIDLVGTIKGYKSQSAETNEFLKTLAELGIVKKDYINPASSAISQALMKQSQSPDKITTKNQVSSSQGLKLHNNLKSQKFKKIQIGVLTEGEFLGEQEVFSTNPYRQFTAFVTQAAVVFRLDLQKFINSIDKTEFKDHILKRAIAKSLLRQKLSQNTLKFWELQKGPGHNQIVEAKTKPISSEFKCSDLAQEIINLQQRSINKLFKHVDMPGTNKTNQQLTKTLQKKMENLQKRDKTFLKKKLERQKTYEPNQYNSIMQNIMPLNQMKPDWTLEHQDKYQLMLSDNLKLIAESNGSNFSRFSKIKKMLDTQLKLGQSQLFCTQQKSENNSQQNLSQTQYQTDIFQRSQLNSMQIKKINLSASQDHSSFHARDSLYATGNIFKGQSQEPMSQNRNQGLLSKTVLGKFNSQKNLVISQKKQNLINRDQDNENDKHQMPKLQYRSSEEQEQPQSNFSQSNFEDQEKQKENQSEINQENSKNQKNKELISKKSINIFELQKKQFERLKILKDFHESQELINRNTQFQVTPLLAQHQADKKRKMVHSSQFNQTSGSIFQNFQSFENRELQPDQGSSKYAKEKMFHKRNHSMPRLLPSNSGNLGKGKTTLKNELMKSKHFFKQSQQNKNKNASLNSQSIGLIKSNSQFNSQFENMAQVTQLGVTGLSQQKPRSSFLSNQKETVDAYARKGDRSRITQNRFKDKRQTDGYLVQKELHQPNKVLMSSTHSQFRPAPRGLHVQLQIYQNMH